MNSTFLILTIGTGTKGQHSSLAHGMASTIRQTAPRQYWLAPSASPDSKAMADLVRETIAATFQFVPWSDTEPYRCIEEPDDLFSCRAAIREIIARARKEVKPGDRLIVNPTSGTKQMSVGATLAALDAEIGDIVFTTGQRADGVVMTGTEKLTPFKTKQFFRERAWREARQLFACGSFRGAANLLSAHGETLAEPRDAALCLYEWQRLNYDKARQIAARSPAAELAPCRGLLEKLARAPELSVERLGDLLASADALLEWDEPEEALARYYRAMEVAAKLRLKEEHRIEPPYDLETMQAATPTMGKRFRDMARDGRITLGLTQSMEILDTLQDDFGREYWRDESLRTLLTLRNKTFAGHGTESVAPDDVKAARKAAERLLKGYFPDLELYWTLNSRPQFPVLS